jgi:MFS family permease
MASVRETYVAPNGGWGWMVVVGGTLINMFNQSLLSVFGLLFGSYFTVLNESKTRIALVMNLCSAFLNLTGFFTAPLMKKFSPREVAVFGCLLVSVGLMLSSFVTSLVQVIFTYSICVGVGLGLLGPPIFISLSSYFTTRKSRAVSLTMAGTGFGQMILPQVVRLLLSEYGFRGTVLIMGSLSLHGIVGACLFQPVEWHLKRRESDCEMLTETEPLLCRSSTSQAFVNIDYNGNGFWKKVAHSLDLSLLKDPRFVILNVGLACAYTVSIDFTLVLPFFLQVIIIAVFILLKLFLVSSF